MISVDCVNPANPIETGVLSNDSRKQFYLSRSDKKDSHGSEEASRETGLVAKNEDSRLYGLSLAILSMEKKGHQCAFNGLS